jgi:acetyl-CoA synthetase
MSNTASARFLAARDFLQQHRSDYERAYRDYRAPALDEFNWALDFFDVQAEGNHARPHCGWSRTTAANAS